MPQQKATPQASFAGIRMSKKKRCSSGQTSAAARLVWIGSGLMKCCGRLHHPDGGVIHQADGPTEEVGPRHEVGVKNCDEVRRLRQFADMSERVVDVTSLGMLVVGPREIAATELLREASQPKATSVVEHPDAVVAILHSGRADDGSLQDRFVLVVGANEDVDQRSCGIPGAAVDLCIARTVDGSTEEEHR